MGSQIRSQRPDRELSSRGATSLRAIQRRPTGSWYLLSHPPQTVREHIVEALREGAFGGFRCEQVDVDQESVTAVLAGACGKGARKDTPTRHQLTLAVKDCDPDVTLVGVFARWDRRVAARLWLRYGIAWAGLVVAVVLAAIESPAGFAAVAFLAPTSVVLLFVTLGRLDKLGSDFSTAVRCFFGRSRDSLLRSARLVHAGMPNPVMLIALAPGLLLFGLFLLMLLITQDAVLTSLHPLMTILLSALALLLTILLLMLRRPAAAAGLARALRPLVAGGLWAMYVNAPVMGYVFDRRELETGIRELGHIAGRFMSGSSSFSGSPLHGWGLIMGLGLLLLIGAILLPAYALLLLRTMVDPCHFDTASRAEFQTPDVNSSLAEGIRIPSRALRVLRSLAVLWIACLTVHGLVQVAASCAYASGWAARSANPLLEASESYSHLLNLAFALLLWPYCETMAVPLVAVAMLLVYLGTIVFVLVRQCSRVAFGMLSARARSSNPLHIEKLLSGHVSESSKRVASELSIPTPSLLVGSNRVESGLSAGGGAVIFLPADFASAFPEDEQFALIAHEMCHIARHLPWLRRLGALSFCTGSGPNLLVGLLDTYEWELEADRYAVRALGRANGWEGPALLRALEKLETRRAERTQVSANILLRKFGASALAKPTSGTEMRWPRVRFVLDFLTDMRLPDYFYPSLAVRRKSVEGYLGRTRQNGRPRL